MLPNTGWVCQGDAQLGRTTYVKAAEVVERPAGVVTVTRMAPALGAAATTASRVLLRTVTLSR